MSNSFFQEFNHETGSEFLKRLSRQSSLQYLEPILFPNLEERSIVEISGGAGVGKTQLLMHLIVKCITPKYWKDQVVEGFELGVIYVDCDHHFPMLRLVELLECKLKSTSKVSTAEEMHEFVMACLKRMSTVKCTNSLQLSATLQRLSQSSEYKQRGYKVIMIDSLSAFYWEDCMTKIRSFELRNFYSHIATVLQKLVDFGEFALFFVRLAFKKSSKGEECGNDYSRNQQKSSFDEEYYYLGKDIQQLSSFKYNLIKDKNLGNTIILDKMSGKEIQFQIFASGFKLSLIKSD